MKNLRFKVFTNFSEKSILFKGNFSLFENYSQLVEKAIKKSKLGLFSDFPLNFSENNLFIFTLKDEKDQKKTNIKHFFNEKTYQYFKERIKSKKLYDPNYKYLFTIEKIEKEPEWNPPKYPEYLAFSLNSSRIKLLNDLILTSELMEDFKGKIKKKKNEISDKEKHRGIICESCLTKDFYGKRFICSECNNYNLCQKCESSLTQEKFHNENHVMIQINSPSEIDLNNYSNLIDKNFIHIKKEENKIKVKIVNNSNFDLKDCFIQPIRYGANYLKCGKKEIQKIAKGQYTDVEIILEKSKENEKLIEGYFRMFTKTGFPFGEIIKVIVT